MRHRKVVSLVAALCLLLSTTAAFAEDWAVLGERAVTYRDPVVTIPAKSDSDAVAKVKFAVSRNYLEIDTVTVTFSDGKTFEATLNQYVAPGKSSNEITLPAAQKISKVEFTYRNVSSNKHLAMVQLLGSA